MKEETKDLENRAREICESTTALQAPQNFSDDLDDPEIGFFFTTIDIENVESILGDHYFVLLRGLKRLESRKL